MMKTQFAPTQAALAEMLHVHRASVIRWIAEGAPRRTARGYSVEAWRLWQRKSKIVAEDSETARLRERIQWLKDNGLWQGGE
jgi:plasmid maintenance system antidote protein VapI